MKPTYLTMVREDLTPRQRSLFSILDAAVEASAMCGEPIYVIHAPVYVDEHATGEHVYATKEAALIMYPKRDAWVKAGLPWSIDARVEPSGRVFIKWPASCTLSAARSTISARSTLNWWMR